MRRKIKIGYRRKPSGAYELRYHKGVWHYRTLPASADKFEAKLAVEQWRREIEDGTWKPGERTIRTVAEFVDDWLSKRADVITVKDDRGRMERYVLPHFGKLPIAEVLPADVSRWLEWLKTEALHSRGKPLSKNSRRNVWGNVVTLFSDALEQGLVIRNPCHGVRKALRPKKAKRSEVQRGFFSVDAIETLISDPRVPWDLQVFWALEALTGMRVGEAAGVRWKDIDRSYEPLPLVELTRQWNGKRYAPLKGKRGEPGNSRHVPLHPTANAMVAEWWLRGFALLLGRRPRPEDVIVPNKFGEPRKRHASLESLKHWCEVLGIVPRGGASKAVTQHSFRNAFITNSRINGAPDIWVERITHNAEGNVLSGYTVNDWKPMCEAVLCIKVERRKYASVTALKAKEGA